MTALAACAVLNAGHVALVLLITRPRLGMHCARLGSHAAKLGAALQQLGRPWPHAARAAAPLAHP